MVAAETALAQPARAAAEALGLVPQVADPEATAPEVHQPTRREALQTQALPGTQHQLQADRTARPNHHQRRHRRSLGPTPRALPRHRSPRSQK